MSLNYCFEMIVRILLLFYISAIVLSDFMDYEDAMKIGSGSVQQKLPKMQPDVATVAVKKELLNLKPSKTFQEQESLTLEKRIATTEQRGATSIPRQKGSRAKESAYIETPEEAISDMKAFQTVHGKNGECTKLIRSKGITRPASVSKTGGGLAPYDAHIDPDFPQMAPTARGLYDIPKGWNLDKRIDIGFQKGYRSSPPKYIQSSGSGYLPTTHSSAVNGGGYSSYTQPNYGSYYGINLGNYGSSGFSYANYLPTSQGYANYASSYSPQSYAGYSYYYQQGSYYSQQGSRQYTQYYYG